MACKLNGGSVSFELGYNTGNLYSPISGVSKISKNCTLFFMNALKIGTFCVDYIKNGYNITRLYFTVHFT